jgi:ATP-dependent DNA ligase
MGKGQPFYDAPCKHDVEGIVPKRVDAPYKPDNRGIWRKMRRINEEGFVFIGFTTRGTTIISRRATPSATTRPTAS